MSGVLLKVAPYVSAGVLGTHTPNGHLAKKAHNSQSKVNAPALMGWKNGFFTPGLKNVPENRGFRGRRASFVTKMNGR
jgi:hypothetical protein